MHGLAALLITPVIAFCTLVLSEAFERSSTKAGGDSHILVRDGQAIAPKEGHEPGDASGGNPGFIRNVHVIDAQRAHIFYRLAIGAVQVIVGGDNSGTVLLPARLPFIEVAAWFYMLR